MAVMQPTNQSDLLNRNSYLTTQCTNGILHNQVAHIQIEAIATMNHMYMLLHVACTQQERLASTVDGRTGAQVPTVLQTPSRLGCSELMLRLYSLLRLSLLFTSQLTCKFYLGAWHKVFYTSLRDRLDISTEAQIIIRNIALSSILMTICSREEVRGYDTKCDVVPYLLKCVTFTYEIDMWKLTLQSCMPELCLLVPLLPLASWLQWDSVGKH